MSSNLHAVEAGELPDVLAVFPLPGALLLPRGRLPLNIFEPRYLNLVVDTLGTGRVFGMVQPRGTEVHPVPDDAQLYDTGCAGRISTFSETGDGRFFITLTGISRFRITGELDLDPARGYRRVAARYQAFATDLQEDPGTVADRDRLLAAVEIYFQLKGIEVDWSALKDADDEPLVTSLAMICPFEPREKQALLECDGVAARAVLLTTLMEMAGHEGAADATPARH